MENKYTEINSRTWDTWSKEQYTWTIPITHEEYIKGTRGEWGIYLTPCKTVPKEWFGELKKKNVLGLASGGGQQMPILTALGAICTSFDNSEQQLEKERQVAQREGYQINIIKGDMSKPLPFEDDKHEPLVVKHRLPYNPFKMSEQDQSKIIKNNEGIQFSHSLEEQIGGQLKAGFTLIDLYEDRDRGGVIAEYTPQYYAIKSIKAK